jgi:hypothetical protein
LLQEHSIGSGWFQSINTDIRQIFKILRNGYGCLEALNLLILKTIPNKKKNAQKKTIHISLFECILSPPMYITFQQSSPTERERHISKEERRRKKNNVSRGKEKKRR